MLSWKQKKWWNRLENFTWTLRACNLRLPKIWVWYMLLGRVSAHDKSTAFQSYQDRMLRSDGLVSNLQHGVCKRRIFFAWMSKRQVHEKVKNASIWSGWISSRASYETEKIKGRTWTLFETIMRWKV